MFRTKIALSVPFALAVVLTPPPVRASDECAIVAELSVEAVKEGALLVCTRTGHPLACAIAAAAQDAATSGVAKKAVEKGCEYVVERIEKSRVRIKVTGPAVKKSEVNQARDDLNLAKPKIKWIAR